VKSHLLKSAVKLLGYLAVVYLVLRLIPTLNQALTSLKHVSWEWVLGAMALAERQLNLSFLNTGVSALALVVCGLGLATGIFAGEDRLLLTLLPAAVAACGVAALLFIGPRASTHLTRLRAKHAKIARSITTLADAADDTKRVLFHRPVTIRSHHGQA
jgi:hypothetical protein